MTVKELRQALENIPDNLIVVLSSDTGVDQCDDYNMDCVVEKAYRTKYDLPDGQRFDDTGETGVDEFTIYANYVDKKERMYNEMQNRLTGKEGDKDDE